MTNNRIVCFIQETVRAEDGGYLACLCREGEKGYWKTDWNWGTDKEQAETWAQERNDTMGISPEEAIKIQIGTMF